MSDRKRQVPVGTVIGHTERDCEGKVYTVVELDQDSKQKNRGHPVDNKTLAALKSALLAESWVTSQIFMGYDLRAYMPEYKEDEYKRPDTRGDLDRRDDAFALVARVHDSSKVEYKQKCNVDIGYTKSQIERRGWKAAQAHFGKSSLSDFNKFMREEKHLYAKDTSPGMDDETHIVIEILKLNSLLKAVAKCEELIYAKDQLQNLKPKSKRGRPKKTDAEGGIRCVMIFDSEIDCNDLDELLVMAVHTGVNPCTLWADLDNGNGNDEYYKLLEFAAIFGKITRNTPLNEEEEGFMEEVVNPFLKGILNRSKKPTSPAEMQMCSLLYQFVIAQKRTEERLKHS